MTTLDHEIARIIERSEAAAYRSFIQAGGIEISQRFGFRAVASGSAIAVMADRVTSTLNLNRVLSLGVEEPADEDAVERIVKLYAESGAPYAIELSPFAKPTEIKDWLRARRIRRGIETAMLFRGATPAKPVKTAFRIAKTGPKEADQLTHLCCVNFNMPELIGPLIAATAELPGWRQWIVYDGATPVAGSLSYIENGICWLGWTSVVPSHRGRWCHALIVSTEINDAVEAGCEWITTETALSTKTRPDPAHHNLSLFGFTEAYLRPTYIAAQSIKRVQ